MNEFTKSANVYEKIKISKNDFFIIFNKMIINVCSDDIENFIKCCNLLIDEKIYENICPDEER
jgi:hypothetical protein